jgi:hypothetical protein
LLRLDGRVPTNPEQGYQAGAIVDCSLERFPNVYCPTCKKTQPWGFYVLKGNAYVDQDSADIVCSEFKSVLTSLYSDGATMRSDKACSPRDAVLDTETNSSAQC